MNQAAKVLAAKQTIQRGPAVTLPALAPKVTPDAITYKHVTLSFDRANRTGELVVRGPERADVVDMTAPTTWSLHAFRELDDALLRLRFDYPEINIVAVRTVGDPRAVVLRRRPAREDATTGFAREVRLLQRRVLKRFDNTARSFYAVADRADSCFAGVLLELALGADRSTCRLTSTRRLASRCRSRTTVS